MEPKHKELLDQCHQNLLESITDADRLIELLIVSGTLNQLDRFELDQNCSSSAEKVDHLLKMLVNKESDHFLDLCVALEKAYPDLHAALFGNNGGGPVDHSTGKSCPVGRALIHSEAPSLDLQLHEPSPWYNMGGVCVFSYTTLKQRLFIYYSPLGSDLRLMYQYGCCGSNCCRSCA